MRKKPATSHTPQDFEVVVLGSDINAYGIGRSFWKRYSKRIHILTKEVFAPVLNSKLVASITKDENLWEDAQFLRLLHELRARILEDASGSALAKRHADGESQGTANEAKILLIPASDTYAELISRNQEALRKEFVFYTNPYEMFRELGDRDTFYRACDEHNIAYPKTHTIDASSKDSTSLPEEFTFPLILKPGDPVEYFATDFSGKKKVFLASSAKEYDAITSAIYASTYKGMFTVQEFIPGDQSFEGELHAYSDSRGKVTFMQFNQVLLEEVSSGGVGSYSALITGSNAELYEKVRSFLESTGYKGFSNFDLKLDSRDQTWKFFEINQRLSRSSFTIDVAGHSIAELIVQDLLEGVVQEPVFAERAVLYTLLPKFVLRKYVNKRYLEAVDRFYAKRQVYGSFLDGADISLKRLLAHLRMQLSYVKQYHQLFGRSMDFG